ncbi:MAG: PHP domain-containing protein [Ignavibacteriales bacterium]|nr:PHP domain-containing protein [Ignavibacteriales bacterium]
MARTEELGTNEPAQGANLPVSPEDGKADLHTHTIYSDGALPPHELVQKAAAAGISTLAITDHDHVGAIDEAIKAGRDLSVIVIPGVELSVTLDGKDLHILSYFIDFTNPTLLEYLAFFRTERLKRAERMVHKLNSLNVPLKLDRVLEHAGIGAVGRPHIASALMEEGHVGSFHEAFDRFIGIGGPAYETKFQMHPQEAFRLITSSGGLSFLAHPGRYLSEQELLELIKMGLDGIEVVHPSHSDQQREYYRSIVHQYFLLESGGSDFHGGRKNDDHVFGSVTVPLHVVETMRSRLFSQ